MRILVIEDDPQTIELLVRVLEDDGHDVAGERTGTAGLARAIASKWDLIICDIGLPDMNGNTLSRQLRRAGIDVPLLALSGYATDEDRTLGLASGFDQYLAKPIDPAAVVRAVVAMWNAAKPGRRPCE